MFPRTGSLYAAASTFASTPSLRLLYAAANVLASSPSFNARALRWGRPAEPATASALGTLRTLRRASQRGKALGYKQAGDPAHAAAG
eukprot:8385260-Pyramimonas_sp.AAC.1